METAKVGMREFRHRFGDYAESANAVAITKHGRTVGFYIPLRRKPAVEDLAAFREAGQALHALMAEKGISEDELVADFKAMVKASKNRRR